MTTGQFIQSLPEDLREWVEEILEAHGPKSARELRESPIEETIDPFIRGGMAGIIHIAQEAPSIEVGLKAVSEEEALIRRLLNQARGMMVDVSKIEEVFENFLWFFADSTRVKHFLMVQDLKGVLDKKPEH